MADFKKCKFVSSTIVLDGNEYIGCEFTQCRIVVTRGNFVLKNSSFDGCNFEFGGEAANIRSLILLLQNQPVIPAEAATITENPEQKNNGGAV